MVPLCSRNKIIVFYRNLLTYSIVCYNINLVR
nr:MAG TPA: hypothetical protein [Caudoviricetes sp.]